MEICSQCGSSIKEGLKFCPGCGAPVAARSADSDRENVFAAAGVTFGERQDYEPQERMREYERPPVHAAQYEPQPSRQYSPPEYEAHIDGAVCETYSTWKFVGLMLLQCIPLLGFILTVVFSFSSGNINRRNFCRALLIIYIAAIFFSVIGAVVFGSSLAAIISSMSGMI